MHFGEVSCRSNSQRIIDSQKMDIGWRAEGRCGFVPGGGGALWLHVTDCTSHEKVAVAAGVVQRALEAWLREGAAMPDARAAGACRATEGGGLATGVQAREVTHL
jgi:hypothetical protein